ncbi:hypothetical protein ABEB36_009183 [Hypothenemus hampei]|uniref:Neuropeptide-like 1 n=1 Tax=Hypothenemus hampei TaxID=57062 RepID=A0ABD1EPG8_HYPHA
MACRMFPELEPQDSTYKRSIEILAKNGQHPLVRQPIENQKRGIEALARNGDLHRPPNYQIQQGNMDYKRNLANLARTYNFPVSNGQSYGKRSLGSLAKNGELPFRYGKRNIQSLARDGVIGKRSIDSDDSPLDKRNIQSLKQRNKRQADYFENEMVYQIPITDYEDYLQELSSQGSYPVEDKRFLGSVAKSGWFRPTSQGYSSFVSLPGKRHVAALARLGWLPSYRSLRRFNRSGRSYLVTTGDDNLCRKDSTNGKTEDDSYSKGPTIPLENKRYLLQPAVDNILLRKVFRHPRTIF